MRLIGSKRPTRAQRPTDSGIVLGVPASDVGVAQPRTVLSTVSLQQVLLEFGLCRHYSMSGCGPVLVRHVLTQQHPGVAGNVR